MADDNKSTKVSGNPTSSSPSSLEKKVKSSVRSAALFTGGVLIGTLAIGAAGYFIALKTREPEYKENTVPIHSSLVDEIANEKRIEDRVRLEYQPQLDAAKEFQGKYETCASDLAKEQAKPAQPIYRSGYYGMIKDNPLKSSDALLAYVLTMKKALSGEVKVQGSTCSEALGNLYSLMASYQNEYDDEQTKKAFIENNKSACRVSPGDDYIVVKLE